MARYRCLAPIYTPGGAYVEIGQTVADDGTGDYPIPSNWRPPPCCDPLDASAIAALTATITGTIPTPTSPTQPPWGVLGLWGIRSQFTTLPLSAPSAAYKAIIHN